MLGLSLPEIIFLAILALVVIGPKQLPEVARTIGRVLNELRRASSSLTEELRSHVKIDPIRLDDPKPPQEMQPHEANQGGHYPEDGPGTIVPSTEGTAENSESNPEDKSEVKKS